MVFWKDKRGGDSRYNDRGDVDAWQRRQRHGGVSARRDPHLFTVLRKDEFEFWYGIHGPDGDHRRYAVGLDTAYRFLRRQVLKLERLYEKTCRLVPDVDIADIDDYVRDALSGSACTGSTEALGKSTQLELELDDEVPVPPIKREVMV